MASVTNKCLMLLDIFKCKSKPGLRTGSKVLLVLMLLLIPYATLTPDPGTPSGSAPFMHLGGMAWVSLLACLSFTSLKNRTLGVLFVFAYSSLMELFQHYLPYRHGTWGDVWLNGLGCLLGAMFFLFIVHCTKLRVL